MMSVGYIPNCTSTHIILDVAHLTYVRFGMCLLLIGIERFIISVLLIDLTRLIFLPIVCTNILRITRVYFFTSKFTLLEFILILIELRVLLLLNNFI